jgi:hypothetical protein
VTGASRFLIGLVTCFATHDGIPAVARASWCTAGLLVTCEIVPRRAGGAGNPSTPLAVDVAAEKE